MRVTRRKEQLTKLSGAFLILIFILVSYFENANLQEDQINKRSRLQLVEKEIRGNGD